jgi:hypothetical protein
MPAKGWDMVTVREGLKSEGDALITAYGKTASDGIGEKKLTHGGIYEAGLKAIRRLLKMKPRAAAASTQKGAH